MGHIFDLDCQRTNHVTFSDRFSDTLKAARQLIGGTNENVLSPLSTQNLSFRHRIDTTKEPFS